MNIEDSKNINQDKDIIDIFFILWEYKLHFLLSFSVGFTLVFFILQSVNSIFQAGKYKTTINVLIEENPFFAQQAINSERKIAEIMNVLLSSSYNYEKWSNLNSTLAKNLSQESASDLKILVDTQTIIIDEITHSVESLSSITSYLSYSANVVSERTMNEIKRNLSIVKDEKEVLSQRDKIMRLERETQIKNANVELMGAEEELDYLLNNITKETQNTTSVTLRQLTLINTIKVNNLIVENLKDKMEKDIALELEYNQELREINRKLYTKIITNGQGCWNSYYYGHPKTKC